MHETRKFFICLLLFVAEIDCEWPSWYNTTGITFDAGTYCSEGSKTQIESEVFSELVGKGDPFTLSTNSSDNALIYNFRISERLRYKYEASYTDLVTSSCGVCQYHLKWLPDSTDDLSVRWGYRPFIAYCLNGEISKRLSCVQNPLFEPPSFYGTFFYPIQIPWESRSDPSHWFLFGDYYGSPTDNNYVPDDSLHADVLNYGISRRNIRRHVYHSLASDPDIWNDGVQSNEVKAHRNFWTSDQKWIKWGQMQCMGFCHRNDMLLSKYIDVVKDVNESRADHIILKLTLGLRTVCRGCFRGTDVVWNNNNKDSLSKNMEAWNDCLPWMGALPVIEYNSASQKYDLKGKLHSLDRRISVPGETDQVYEYPSYEGTVLQMTEYDSVECESGYYNRICPYTMRIRAQANNNLDVVACTKCPGGWHTDGKKASWFCIPPLGERFVNGEKLRNFWNQTLGQSSAWQRRDLLKYEFECGEQCSQCKTTVGASSLTAEQFNEEYIFKPLLETKKCEENFYCPDPLMQDAVACPSNKICSPAGSFSAENCTCCKGDYWNPTSQRCETCAKKSTCAVGTSDLPKFMSGETQCTQELGIKAPSTCVDCTQKPDNSEFVRGNYGFEIQRTGESSTSHFCSFRCLKGYWLKYDLYTSSSDCHKQYTCEPLPDITSIQPFVAGTKYGLQFVNLYDSVEYNTETERCHIKADLSTEYKRLKTLNWQDLTLASVSQTCSQVNPSECNAADDKYCNVSEEATYYQNFKCERCSSLSIAKPANAHYLNETIAMTTDLASRSNLCAWECNEKYYKNGTECMSCEDLSNARCPAGYSIRGMGCLGVASAFNESNWTSNCISCDKDQSHIPANQYLNLDTCVITDCPPPPTLIEQPKHYFSKRCGGGTSKEYVPTPCATTCPSGQYESSPCSENADLKCSLCTSTKPGHHKTSNCTTARDASWQACEENFYCPGDGSKIPCSDNRISVLQSTSSSDCKCRFGTTPSSTNPSECVLKTCDGDTEDNAMPTVAVQNYKSSFYFSLQSDKQTACTPCHSSPGSIKAFTLGDRTLGVAACRCPSSYYSVIGSDKSVTCELCASRVNDLSCSRSSNQWFGVLNNARICATGLQTGSSNPCVCVLPPFTKRASGGACQIDQCSANYNWVSSSQNFATSLEVNVTGSQAYVEDNNEWKKGVLWNHGNLIDLKSTSDYVVEEIPIERTFQLLFFAVENVRDRVLIQTLTQTSPATRFKQGLSATPGDGVENIEGSQFISWRVFDDSVQRVQKKIVKIAAAKWSRSVTLNLFSNTNILADYWTWISALVYDKEEGLYQLYYTRVYPQQKDNQYSYGVDSNTGSIRLDNNSLEANTQIVDLHHAYSYPGKQAWTFSDLSPLRHGAFYVSYNNPMRVPATCGIQAITYEHNRSSGVLKPQLLHLDLSNRTNGRKIQALAVVENENTGGGDGVWIYVLFDDLPHNNQGILLVKWETTATTRDFKSARFGDDTVELIVPDRDRRGRKIQSFRNFMQIWSSSQNREKSFLIIGDTEEQGQKLPVAFTANGITRSFTEIQGMPNGSYSSMLTGFETSLSEIVLLGKGVGRSVFYLEPIKRCFSAETYWDGMGACKNHHCVRKRECKDEENKKTVNDKCVCKDGYKDVAGRCEVCPQNKYCTNGLEFSCPSTQLSNQGSYLREQCRCALGWYYDETSSVCRPCTAGYYCPNRWSRVQCPGTFKLTSSLNAQYPTQCECQPGFEGATCIPCLDGHMCPESSFSANDKTNVAVLISIEAKTPDMNYLIQTQSNTVKTMACDGTLRGEINSQLVAKSTDLAYLKPKSEGGELESRFYCEVIRSPDANKVHHMLVAMLQFNWGDAGESVLANVNQMYQSISTKINNVTTSELHNYVRIVDVQPKTLSPIHMKSNKRTLCTNFMSPSTDRTTCSCSPGYSMSLGRCTACAVGYFKSQTSNLACTSCPAGKTTFKVGSIACVDPQSGGGSGSQNGGSGDISSDAGGGNMIGIIVGGVVGGVVLLLIVIFVYYYMTINKTAKQQAPVAFADPVFLPN